MKRLFAFCLMLCLCVCGISGCSRKAPRQLCRVVTQVDIFCQKGELPIHRCYTDPDKMQSVLLYVRLLKPRGTPEVNPLSLNKEVYQITLHLSDGSKHIYQQTGHRYFQNYQGMWKKILPQSAAGLYALMEHLPSDIPIAS